ncbi:hypothetical protein ACFSL6_21890 [Paenibacillus thailandensis]|uniref:Uncharacterized protein n=1 Tax=Paenibacillus thailandensis TaxID=393250 RepID=A0ABW5R469_9BACL
MISHPRMRFHKSILHGLPVSFMPFDAAPGEKKETARPRQDEPFRIASDGNPE